LEPAHSDVATLAHANYACRSVAIQSLVDLAVQRCCGLDLVAFAYVALLRPPASFAHGCVQRRQSVHVAWRDVISVLVVGCDVTSVVGCDAISVVGCNVISVQP
jgi:hypothetical protein